jgi:hypothetical protein
MCRYGMNNINSFEKFVSVNDVTARREGSNVKGKRVAANRFALAMVELDTCGVGAQTRWCEGDLLTKAERKRVKRLARAARAMEVQAEKVADEAHLTVANTAVSAAEASQREVKLKEKAQVKGLSVEAKLKAREAIREGEKLTDSMRKKLIDQKKESDAAESLTARVAAEAIETAKQTSVDAWYEEMRDKTRLMPGKKWMAHPDASLGHEAYMKQVNKVFGQFKWAAPKLEDNCAKADKRAMELEAAGKPAPVELSQTQKFMTHYLTPVADVKGTLLWTSTGGGKTCTATNVAENFKRVLWVTKGSLKGESGIERSLLIDLCSPTLLSLANKGGKLKGLSAPKWNKKTRDKELAEANAIVFKALAGAGKKGKANSKREADTKARSTVGGAPTEAIKTILRKAGTHWLAGPQQMSITYQQFANFCKQGSGSKATTSIIARRTDEKGNFLPEKQSEKNPSKFLQDTLVVIDEAHLLYQDKEGHEGLTDGERLAISKMIRKNETCKVLLMSATPGDTVNTLVRLTNLLKHTKESELEFDSKTTSAVKGLIRKKWVDDSGKITESGKRGLAAHTQGLVSYLNVINDPSRFVTIKRHKLEVTMSEVQSRDIETACLGVPGYTKVTKVRQKKGKAPEKDQVRCIRKRAMLSGSNPSKFAFDRATPLTAAQSKEFRKAIKESAPKLQALVHKIASLDADDAARYGTRFKHIIFSDMGYGYGAKLVVSALAAQNGPVQYRSVVKNTSKGLKLDLQSDSKGDTTNVGIMTTSTLFTKDTNKKNGRGGRTLNDNMLETFNDRDNNAHGSNIRILALGRKFGVGLDAFDVKYLHILEPQLTQASLTQAEGRGTRFCGQKMLKFDKKLGWQLHIFNYVSKWSPDTLEPHTETPAQRARTIKLTTNGKTGVSLDAMALETLTDDFRVVVFAAAVDAGLNWAINGIAGNRSLVADMDIDQGNAKVLQRENEAGTKAAVKGDNRANFGENLLRGMKNEANRVLNALMPVRSKTPKELVGWKVKLNKFAQAVALKRHPREFAQDATDIEYLTHSIMQMPSFASHPKTPLSQEAYDKALQLITKYRRYK